MTRQQRCGLVLLIFASGMLWGSVDNASLLGITRLAGIVLFLLSGLAIVIDE